MENDTFFSIASSTESSDATFLTCISSTGTYTSGTLEVLSESQNLDEEDENEISPNRTAHSGENLDIPEHDEEEENHEDDKTAEEEEVTTVINEEELRYDDMMSGIIEYTEHCNRVTMNSTDTLKGLTSLVENETKDVIQERDQALMDLRAVEQAFSDVFRKYERAKLVLENLKKNEEHLKVRDEEFQLRIAAKDEKGEAFKQEKQQMLERMYNEFSTKLAAVESESSKLSARHRRAEMRVETLEAELTHKQRENAQLNVLADDLIGKSANN